MKTKTCKKFICFIVAALAVLAAAVFSGCSDRAVEFREGTWETRDLTFFGVHYDTISFTVKYLGGDIGEHEGEEFADGYIYVDGEAYTLTFNIDGSEFLSESSTYYRRELFGSGFTYNGYEFHMSGKLKQRAGTDEAYFYGGITVWDENGSRNGASRTFNEVIGE